MGKLQHCACWEIYSVHDIDKRSANFQQIFTFPDQDDSGVKSVKRRSNPMEDITDSYEFSNDDLDELVKRGSLFRFGKRGALFRFGKRNDDDKRGSLFRFGKRMDGYYVSPYVSSENFPEKDDKRGSLFRFGKRSSLFRFGRSVDNEKPHTPFRFGREEEDEI